jgi:DNA topoisomerase IA
MKLVIAKKPSVAASLAVVLGADKRENGCFTGNGHIVSYCYGHLLELAHRFPLFLCKRNSKNIVFPSVLW